MISRIRCLAWATVWLSASATGYAGHLDSTFGNAGRIAFAERDQGWNVMSLPDGRIQTVSVAAGRLIVHRYDSHGKPDPGFGTDGRLETTVPSGWVDDALIAAQFADGSVLLRSRIQGNDHVQKVDASGRPDLDFGRNGTFEFPPPINDIDSMLSLLWDVAQGPDGSLYALIGHRPSSAYYDCDTETHIYRLLPDGRPDPDYGDAGQVSVTPLCWFNDDWGILLVPGEQGVVYVSAIGGQSDVALFDQYGSPRIAPAPWSDWLRSVQPLAQNAIAATSGHIYTTESNRSRTGEWLTVVRRWHDDLSPDVAFGATGDGTLELEPRDWPSGTAADARGIGRILPSRDPATAIWAEAVATVGGKTDAWLIRVQHDGTLDRGFGNNGFLSTAGDVKLVDTARGLLVSQRDYGVVRLDAMPMDNPGLLVPRLDCRHGETVQAGAPFALEIDRLYGEAGPASIAYRTAPLTAQPGVDYESTDGTVTWNDGESGPRTVSLRTFAPPRPRGSIASFKVSFEADSGSPAPTCQESTITMSWDTDSQPVTPGSAQGSGGGGALGGGFLGALLALVACGELGRRRRRPGGRAWPFRPWPRTGHTTRAER